MTVRILLTGATGFLGRALLKELLYREHEVTAAVRHASPVVKGLRSYPIVDIGGTTDWLPALQGIEVVVHAAARVHVVRERHPDPLAEYRHVNVDGTLRLARQAAMSGVRRFVFISSIKVNGEGTLPGHPYKADDEPRPTDPYGISKFEAEQALQALAAETGMEVVIVRPVLIYGPGVKGNFHTLLGWLDRGIPLPLGAIHNLRSLVALDNLVDMIMLCLEHSAAANQVFLVSDGEDLSTPELLMRLGRALGKPARLLPIPQKLLECAAQLLGKKAIAQRLFGFLQVDMEKTRRLLDWQPPFSSEKMLDNTAKAFLSSKSKQ